jgi:uncharacterized protein YbaR (Trm112 family)
MPPPELLALLVCPETHQDVALASAAELAALNDAIQRGEVRNRAGLPIAAPLEAALIRVDRAVAYPIVEDFPVMLIPEALDLQSLDLRASVGVAARG